FEERAPDDDRCGTPFREGADVVQVAHATAGVKGHVLACGAAELLEEDERWSAQPPIRGEIDDVEGARAAQRGGLGRELRVHSAREQDELGRSAAWRELPIACLDLNDRVLAARAPPQQ